MRVKYVFVVAFGAVCYGALSSFAKIAYGQGYSAGEITFCQALFGAAILWLLALGSRREKDKRRMRFNGKLLLAGTSMGCSAFCFYLSVRYIPVSLSIVLLMQVAWISNLMECLVFKKRLSVAEMVSSLVIISGTVLAGNLLNAQHSVLPPVGIFLSLAAACFYAVYVLFTSKLGNDVPKLEKSAWMTTGSALMILLINLPSLAGSPHLDPGLLKWGLLLAVFGTVIPPICFTAGMPKIGPGLSAILLTLELPSVVLCAHLILNEPVELSQILGIGVMIGAIIYLNLAKNRKDMIKPTPDLENGFV